MSSPFTRLLGITQGRIQPQGWTAPLGDYALCLGSDLPGDVQPFVDNDGLLFTQNADITGVNLVRFAVRMRPVLVDEEGTGIDDPPVAGFMIRYGFIGDVTIERRLCATTKERDTISPAYARFYRREVDYQGIIPCAHLTGTQNMFFYIRFGV